ncbi:hypothetical protein CLU92_5473 [Janthinobacterium sp. 61]|uniref:hypothetical protein n=1 Tax=Janthinobacterium sp. 61 TaxID=2035209 RepID=UPI000C707670|nr:hypothetical protein [Janthinobacterium sp. 61]PKV47998.1 hypothetical protein CLU92_5473 [Janthinobacterium sp. 61]
MIILDPIAVSDPGVFVSSNVPENDYPERSLTKVYAAGERVIDPATHTVSESKVGVSSAVTLSIASPGIVTWVAHGQAAGTPVSFATTGALPTGLVAGATYYVLSPAANTFSLSATVGGAAIATTGSQSGVHTASAGLNVNKPLSDTTYWLPKGATNRWKMVDAYNNTQTENPESIVQTFKPQAIAQGIYLGNLDAAEVVITSTDPAAGVVYQQAFSLIVSSSGSSMYRWLFNRRRRRTSFLALDLPLYYNAAVTIAINNPGGIAKCGMCCIGPIEEIGGTEYGLGRDFKDWSTTKFNFDGTSETTERGFSKRMSLDLIIDNDQIEYAHERMEGLRQKTIVYIGATVYGGFTVVCGKFSSLKSVIAGFIHSKMAMQIEGTV